MAEYIEREAAISVIAKILNESDMPVDWNEGMSDAMCAVCRIPAADVVPVRHGHYVGEFDGFADGYPVYDMWYCSECGCYFEEWDEKPTYNYCPNCGARMDGEKGDNQ